LLVSIRLDEADNFSCKTCQEDNKKGGRLSRIANLHDINVAYQKLKENQSDFSKLVLQRSFGSYANWLLVGNAPVGSIEFLDPKDSVDTIIKIVGELLTIYGDLNSSSSSDDS
jgi:hypothetical protein